ncbi:MAG: hypothetical protein ABIO78_03690, partial [Thermoanaerobaculia bacterium]
MRVGEPVTVGVPLPAALCTDEQCICVSGAAGVVPVQAQALERWPDGSIRWALLDFQANAPASYDVSFGSTPVPLKGLVLREQNGTAEIESADLVFRVYSKGEFRVDVSDARGVTGPRRLSIDVMRQDGTLVHPDVTSIAWETQGGIRSVLRVDAVIDAGSRRALQLVARLHFYARLRTVRFELTVLNPARAQHPDGFWELGDVGSILIGDCSVRIDTGAASSVHCSVDAERALETFPLPFELYQDSSGGDNWQSTVHVNRDGVVPVSFCGYRLNAGGDTREGRRATPVIWSDGGAARTGIAVRHFWQNSPKSLEADTHQLVLRLFPGQFADLHEIQGGEQKTHVFH